MTLCVVFQESVSNPAECFGLHSALPLIPQPLPAFAWEVGYEKQIVRKQKPPAKNGTHRSSLAYGLADTFTLSFCLV